MAHTDNEQQMLTLNKPPLWLAMAGMWKIAHY